MQAAFAAICFCALAQGNSQGKFELPPEIRLINNLQQLENVADEAGDHTPLVFGEGSMQAYANTYSAPLEPERQHL